MNCKLANICDFAKQKIDVASLDISNYISTENMMPNKAGIADAATLPNVVQTQSFAKGDTLVSNIRPYFKKIWYASFDGGCSNDVLVFRAKTNVNSRFLYYVLADDTFFEYATSTAKGTKMPRGDKKAILEYEVPNISYKEQEKIADVLSALDDKITLNQQINKNLLEQLITLYRNFVESTNCVICTIGDIAKKVAMGPFGSNIKVSSFVESGVPIISGNHLRGYFLEEGSFNYITEEHAERLKNSIVFPHDIIFTHAGNIGQVAMIPDGCNYSRYILSQRQFYLRCDEHKVVPEYVLLFFHSIEGQHELLSYANQTGVPSIAQPATNLKRIEIPIPLYEKQVQWKETIMPLVGQYLNNRHECDRLSRIRDALLPRLMSGEIDVSNIAL